MNKIESGTIIQGTLREEDLLEAFACELETLVEYADNPAQYTNKLLRITNPQELDESFLAENPTQYLTCGDCHDIIDEYTVIESEV